MVAFEGRVWACCGKDRDSNLLSSVEAYDPEDGVWKTMVPTGQARRAMQMVAC